MPTQKGVHRAGVQASRAGRHSRLDPGRGRSLSGDPPTRSLLATRGPSGPSAPRVYSRRNRQVAPALSPGDGADTGASRRTDHQRRAASLAKAAVEPDPFGAARPDTGASPRVGTPLERLGLSRRLRRTLWMAVRSPDLDLGQSGGSPHSRNGGLVSSPGDRSFIYAPRRQLAEPGRKHPADRGAARAFGAASPGCPGNLRLVGGDGTRLECRPDPLFLGRQTLGTPPASTGAPPIRRIEWLHPASCASSLADGQDAEGRLCLYVTNDPLVGHLSWTRT